MRWWKHRQIRAWIAFGKRCQISSHSTHKTWIKGWSISHINQIQLHTQYRPRLLTAPSSVMETVVEVSNEDPLANPHTPHIFAISRLMNHLWRRQLSKDAEVLFTINKGPSYWPCSMHEPIIVLIFCLWLMFQTTEVPGYYGVFLKPLKYRTIWSPDSNILISMDVVNFIT